MTDVEKRKPPDLTMTARGVELASFEDAFRFATAIAQTEMVPTQDRGKPAQIMAKIQMGAELGFAPMQSLKAFHVINGRVGMEALAMKAVVEMSGLMEECEHGASREKDSLFGWCAIKRRGRKEKMYTYNWAQAERAKLTTKDSWKAYPEDMIEYKALSRALRKEFPDVVHGLYSRDELEEMPTPEMEQADAVVRDTVDLSGAKERLFGQSKDDDPPNPSLNPGESIKLAMVIKKPEEKKSEDDLMQHITAEEAAELGLPTPEEKKKEKKPTLAQEVEALAMRLDKEGADVSLAVTSPICEMDKPALSRAKAKLLNLERSLAK